MEEQFYRLTRTIVISWIFAALAFITLFLVTVHQQVVPLFAYSWARSEFIEFLWTLGALAIPFFIVGGLAENKYRKLELDLYA